MIQFNKVSFGYTKSHLLYQLIDLKLSGGNIYGLLGKNGAGKSTLLKLMAGLVFPIKGRIDVLGETPMLRRPSFLQEVFFIPEEIDTPDIQVLTFGKDHIPFYPKFQLDRFKSLLAELEVPEKNMKEMSFGQKKKVWIALGLAANTRLLILDEPTNGLDIPSKRKLRKLFAQHIQDDQCILISTHQIRDLDNLISDLIVVDQGEIIVNTSVEVVSEKLSFKQITTHQDYTTGLYTESNLMGQLVVEENTNGGTSGKIDIELFFNACIANKQRMHSLFKTTL
jgi:ABC-2 type transport system ATP-binding protein